MKKFFKYAERLDQELKKMQHVARADEMITVLGAHKTNALRANDMNAAAVLPVTTLSLAALLFHEATSVIAPMLGRQ